MFVKNFFENIFRLAKYPNLPTAINYQMGIGHPSLRVDAEMLIGKDQIFCCRLVQNEGIQRVTRRSDDVLHAVKLVGDRPIGDEIA